ncbi:DUF805 domain-containing protein [Macrococcus brunensis]|uniref:DUF805 domain-containing protein n=1 Tax=Macrococcus brunensis TaxID=198483 RepID=UPI001EF157A3|nr:DUF805 domain-containing protein [Macrococcus brunensis]ULG72423.1 DUF805 domain-containing protein [Macrococcus brunensis]ULG74677.1 DUF805 domain-containing protein [Macrococcus brunensis]
MCYILDRDLKAGVILIVTMTAMEAYKRFWTQGFNLHDRARRKEFWVPISIHLLLYSIAYILIGMYYKLDNEHIYRMMNLIGNLILIIPTFSVTFRRLQDLNISGWFTLLVPALHLPADMPSSLLNINIQFLIDALHLFVTLILLIIMMFDGTEGPNKYGHDPKEEIDELNPRKY